MRSSTCSRQCFTLAKDLLENGAAALQSNHRPERQLQEKQKRIEFLQKKVQTKDAGCGRSGRQPASVWRVLKQAGLLLRSKGKASRRRIGFEQPLQPHQAWHIDVSYINLFCAARTSMATHPPQRAGSMASGLLGLER